MEVDSTLPGGAIKVEWPRSGEGNVLRLEEAYQGRAMFVKVKCLVGDAPSELSHHPELRLRFPPRPGDGAPLIANGVSIQVRKFLWDDKLGKKVTFPARPNLARAVSRRAGFVSSPTLRSSSRRRALTSAPARSFAQARDDVEVLLKRDRAGCYVSMDELVLFESIRFEISCEKERWATGRVVRDDAEGDFRAADGPWSLELNPSGSALGSTAAHWGRACVDLDASPGAAEDAFGVYPPAMHSNSLSSALGAGARDGECRLGLELCLVGTCDGRHTCMTQESALQWWKVTSPRSFVQRPSLDAVVELHDWPETGSDDEDGSGESSPSDVDDVDVRASSSCSPSNSAGVLDANGESAAFDGARAPLRTAPWSLVPWKGEMSLFDRAELLRNVRKKYEDLMHEYHSTNTEDKTGASNDLFTGELTWFSAGIRIGVGLGLGVCLGLGLGLGVLVNGYKVSRDRLSNMRQALRLGYRR